MGYASLLVPLARWHAEYGFSLADAEVRAVLGRGAMGVLITDGPLDAVRALTAAWREDVLRPLFVAAELGGGVGERFDGGTALPPLAALDAEDVEGVRRAATLTAREARAAGISWALAPSCVDPSLAAPLVRSRTFAGSDAAITAAVSEWIDGCQSEGVVATPGPYPLMHPAAALGVMDAGAGAILLATDHVDDASVIRYLREEAGFTGVIIAPVGMVADQRHEDEEPLAVSALAAGADLVLGIEECAAVERALSEAVRAHVLDPDALHQSAARVATWTSWSDPRVAGRAVMLDDALWARRAADQAVQVQRGRLFALMDPVDVIVVDDDPPRRTPAGAALVETLTRLGHDAQRVTVPTPNARGPVVLALFGDRRLALGFERHSDGALSRVAALVADCAARGRDAVVVHFTPPELAQGLEACPTLVCGWSGTRAMEEAVARRFARDDAR
jgi:beta-glucosidase-like glycosyl hydrolase